MKWMQGMMAVVLGLGLAACAQAPKADVDAAKQALDDAQRAQASDYASEAWTAAKDAEAKLQTELDARCGGLQQAGCHGRTREDFP